MSVPRARTARRRNFLTAVAPRAFFGQILKSLKTLKSSREAFGGLRRLLPEQPRSLAERSCPGSSVGASNALQTCSGRVSLNLSITGYIPLRIDYKQRVA